MKRKTKPKKSINPARKLSSKELCMALAGIAAFHVEDEVARMKIYEAVRRLGLLEDAAIRAGMVLGAADAR